MSSRSAARGSAAASSIRLTSRTSKAVATSRASPSRCFLFCRGSRAARSAPIAAATVAIPPIRKPPQARRIPFNHRKVQRTRKSDGWQGPPPRPRALRSGLDDQAVSNLPPNGEDTAPEPRPAVPVRPAGTEEPVEETYVGAWARSRADCFQETDAPPLAISARRAESFCGGPGPCEVSPGQPEGVGWGTRARWSPYGRR